MAKYSIIIPVRNAARYLPTCVETVLSQPYSDFELIISNNHSTDGTGAYLDALEHPNLKKVMPPEPCCMSEHFEWALAQATGEWLIFLGADDGLLPYFFELADTLTACADKKHIRAIMSRRAYYFWPGCERFYGNTCVSYFAVNRVEVRHSLLGILNALFGIGFYFDLPQMYSNALFHRSLIHDAIKKQGRVFTSITPDANLAALACGLETRYLFSYIPLGWVGASPASNGFSVSVASISYGAAGTAQNEQKNRSNDFFTLNDKSGLRYDARLGNPRLSSSRFLFLDVLYKTEKLRSEALNRLFSAKFLLSLVIAKEYEEAGRDVARIENVKTVSSNLGVRWTCCRTLSPLISLISFAFKARRRFRDFLCRLPGAGHLSYHCDESRGMTDAAQHITHELRRKKIFFHRFRPSDNEDNISGGRQ